MLSGFVLPVLEYWSAVWCPAAHTHLKQLDRVVSGASFLTGRVFKYNLAHRRSVAVVCMLYKIRCNPFYPLYGALPVPYVPVRVIHGDVMVIHGPAIQNLAVQQGFYSIFSISMERSKWSFHLKWAETIRSISDFFKTMVNDGTS